MLSCDVPLPVVRLLSLISGQTIKDKSQDFMPVWETHRQHIHIGALRTAPVGVNHKVGDGRAPV